MFGQVGRAVELPISLSLGIARRGVALTARVAGWALTEIANELSADRSNGRAEPPETVYEHAPRPPAAAEPPTVVSQDEVPDPTAAVEDEPALDTTVRERSPHSALNNPITEPDLTEWPDPYDHREDPRDPGDEMVFGGDVGHTQTGATSTSEPHPSKDPEAEPWEGPKRDKVDQ